MKNFLYALATDKINGRIARFLKAFLWVLSIIYGYVVQCILWVYENGVLKQHRLPRPVISVGNLTLGGAGKTPLVEFIARELKEKGLKPVILMRGYMAEAVDGREYGASSGGNNGKGYLIESDEAEMLEKGLEGVPVLVGVDRLANAREFLEKQGGEVDVFILDDGFQHWRLFRDLDIVVINALDPWGNGNLLPRGILREPLSSLSRADIFVLTKTDFRKQNVQKIRKNLATACPAKLVAESVHKPTGLVNLCPHEEIGLSFLKGKDICSLCSIGDHKSFKNTLLNSGSNVMEEFSFIDHHVYRDDDILEVAACCLKKNLNIVVTTEKDAVKLARVIGFFGNDLTVLSLKISISIIKGEGEFLERINSVLHR